MSIYKCSSCGRLLFRPDELSGRAWQCPTCGPIVIADEPAIVSPALSTLLEQEYQRGPSAELIVPVKSTTRAPMPNPGPSNPFEIDSTEVRWKRWKPIGVIIGFGLLGFNLLKNFIDNPRMISIWESLFTLLIGGCLASFITIVIGSVGEIMWEEICDLPWFRSKKADKALEAMDNDELTSKWTSQPDSDDEPSGLSDTDSDFDSDLPPLAETDIISDRRPAHRNAAPTDIQPGEPPP